MVGIQIEEIMPKPLHITSIFAWICILSHLSLSAKAEVAAEAAAVAAAETVGGEDRALDGDIDRPCSLICLNGGSCQLSTDAEVAQLGHPSQYCSCPTGYCGITWCVRSYRISMRRKLLRLHYNYYLLSPFAHSIACSLQKSF